MVNPTRAIKLSVALAFLGHCIPAYAHPLRLSLSEIEYNSDQELITVSLRLFLMDVREALIFDPQSAELAFTLPHESPAAERLLLNYVNRLFYVKANGEKVDLQIKRKRLSGEGDNTALGVLSNIDKNSLLNPSKSRTLSSPTCFLIKTILSMCTSTAIPDLSC